jgi:chaperonin GroES
MKMKPLGDRVLIRFVEAEEKIGGIIIPDTVKEKPQQGIVEAVGDGKVGEDGKRQAMDVKPGDKVLFGRWAGTEVRLGDKEYMVLHQTEILAVL